MLWLKLFQHPSMLWWTLPPLNHICQGCGRSDGKAANTVSMGQCLCSSDYDAPSSKLIASQHYQRSKAPYKPNLTNSIFQKDSSAQKSWEKSPKTLSGITSVRKFSEFLRLKKNLRLSIGPVEMEDTHSQCQGICLLSVVTCQWC